MFNLSEIGKEIQSLVGDIFVHRFCQEPILSIRNVKTQTILKETVMFNLFTLIRNFRFLKKCSLV